MKKLGIISDCIHAILPNGDVGSKNHVLVRQLEELAKYFEVFTIACPFEEYNEEVKYYPYSRENIRFIQSKVLGGTTLKAKWQIIKTLPLWFSIYREIDQNSDIIYLRFPNNISIPGFLYFLLKRRKMFATYTGSWDYDPYTSFSYRLQKVMLRLMFAGPVMVYRKEDKIHPKIKSSYSPSYSETVWHEETANIESRISRLKRVGIKELSLITIGALTENKNQKYIFQSCEILKKHGIPFKLTIVGAGKRKTEYAYFLKLLNLENDVKLIGPQNYMEVRQLLREHDFLLHASLSEGFAKVPIEAMFHGCIPILGNKILLAQKFIQGNKNGYIFNTDDSNSLANLCQVIYGCQPVDQLIEMIYNGRSFVKEFTLENWAKHYINNIKAYFD